MRPSTIGWTDYSGGDLNFVTGCTPVSEGCANCYARRIYEWRGWDFSQVTFHPDKLKRLQGKRFPTFSPKRGAPHKPMAFVCDTGDLFHEDISDEIILMALDMMLHRSDVTWQILTKREDRLPELLYWWSEEQGLDPLPNHLWFGVTAENQRCADRRIAYLLDTPAAVRFVSVEPCLSPVNLDRWLWLTAGTTAGPWEDGLGRRRWGGTGIGGQMMSVTPSGDISFVICGAESGPNRRPFDVQWSVDLYEQCREAGVPWFGKQDSAFRPGKPLVLPRYGVVQEWPAEGRKGAL